MSPEPAPSRKRALAALFATVLVDLLGFGMILPLLPFYAQTFGASVVQVGVLFGSFSFAQLFCAPLLGRLSDQLGRRPVLLASIVGGFFAYLLFAAAPSFGPLGFTVLVIARLAAGASAANFAVAPAFIADVMPAEKRSQGMAIIGAAFGLGFTIGPAIGGLLGAWGHQTVALGAAALAAINLVMAYLWLPEPRPQQQRAATASRWFSFRALASLGRNRPLTGLLTLWFLVTFCFSLMESTLPFLAQERFGFGQRETSWLFVLIGVVLVITQGGVVGPLARRIGEPRMLLAGIVVLAASLLTLPQAPEVALLRVACGGLAIGTSLVNPASLALLSRSAAAGDQGEVMGLSQSAGSLARIAGPLIGTLLFARVGPAWPFLAGGGLMVAAFLFAVLVMRWVGGATAEAPAETG